MSGKDLYKIWAPGDAGPWTRFAKPALFVNFRGLSFSWTAVQIPEIPADLQHYNSAVAYIIDLPGAAGVEAGLALAKAGLRPVPLFNGINERSIGGLREVVNNEPIVEAIQAGGDILKDLPLPDEAPPVFLLDYNRHNEPDQPFGMYDNRWSLELDDMPAAEYMQNNGITRIVIWTIGVVHKDLEPILDSYRDMGIEILTYSESTGLQTEKAAPVEDTTETTPPLPPGNDIQQRPAPTPPQGIVIDPQKRAAYLAANEQTTAARRDEIRKFENGRFGLMLVVLMVAVNLIFMFFVREEPLLWTAPSIMWLTYLWVPELVGDVIAVLMFMLYLVLYLMCQKRRGLMKWILLLFIFESAVFYIYAMYYGLVAFTGYSFLYGVVVFGFPVFALVFLISGNMALRHVKDMSDWEYFNSLDKMDSENRIDIDDIRGTSGTHGSNIHHGPRRRHFRGFRGYGGYGGSGSGGYRGGGYRGYGGGYGGGFGG